LDSSWSITSGDGSIDVAVPADLPANIEASSGDGRITPTFRSPRKAFMSKSRVRGKMNGGGFDTHHPHRDGSIHLKQV